MKHNVIKKPPMIAVLSRSFSKNETLRKALLDLYPNSIFNLSNKINEKMYTLLKDADGVIVGSEKINSDIYKKCCNLKIISKYGVGLDNIDLNKCKEYNIYVKRTLGINALSVAELTLGFMLTMSHNAYYTSLKLKEKTWHKSGGALLSGKKIGLIGIGHVGKSLINLLKNFSCNILVNDIINQEQYYKENNLFPSSKNEIFKSADIISLHTPLTNKTHHLINKKSLTMMIKKPLIINTSRGKVINEEDLTEALYSQRISGVALDVFEKEPTTINPLLNHPQAFCTPHIAGNSEEAVLQMGRAAICQLNQFFTNRKHQNL